MGFEINKRIQLFIDELQITPYEFSKRMGIKRPDGLYKILDLKTKPSPKTLEKIKETYPELSYNWLLTGEGEMKKGPEKSGPEKKDTAGGLAKEAQNYYQNATLQSVHLDLKNDIKELAKGTTANAEVLSEAMEILLRGQQKILDFIEPLNAKTIADATSNLIKYLEHPK